MSSYFGPAKRISIRRQREALADNVVTAKVTEAALTAFLNMTFRDRIVWLLFGAKAVWKARG